MSLRKTTETSIQSKLAEYKNLRVKAKESRLAIYQLATLLDCGISIVDAIETLARSNEGNMKLALSEASLLLQRGFTLSKALSFFPKIFPPIVRELALIGEETGQLAATLQKAADWQSKQTDLQRKLVSAFTYPVVVGIVALLVNLLVLTFSIPEMNNMLESLRIEPPTLTKIVFGIGAVVVHPLFLSSIALSVVLLWTMRARIFTSPVQLTISRLLLSTPVVGDLWKSVTLARITGTLALAFDVNLNVLRSFQLALSSCGNPVYKLEQKRLLQCLRDGDSLSTVFENSPAHYPSLFRHYLSAGEEAGEVVTALKNLGDQFETEVDHRVALLGAAMEPILLAVISVFVGTFILAAFLPLQKFLSQLL